MVLVVLVAVVGVDGVRHVRRHQEGVADRHLEEREERREQRARGWEEGVWGRATQGARKRWRQHLEHLVGGVEAAEDPADGLGHDGTTGSHCRVGTDLSVRLHCTALHCTAGYTAHSAQ